jgi:polygalacturonase
VDVTGINLAQIFLADVSLDATAQSNDENAAVELANSNMTPTGPNVTTGTFTASGAVPACAF